MAKLWLSVITRAGDKVQVMSAVSTMQSGGHEKDQDHRTIVRRTRPCKERKDGAPTFQNGKGIKYLKGGPPAKLFLELGKFMGWFALDIFAAFLFKSIVRSFYLARTSNWSRGTATLLAWQVQKPGMGCPSVRVRYRVVSGGGAIVKKSEVPFLLENSAERYAETLSKSFPVAVRVNPENPEKMEFFKSDQ